MGVSEGEEEEQEIENLFEQIMKENFLNLAKEINVQAQETQRIPTKLEPRKHTPRHIIITLPKMKQKERILEAVREKDIVSTPIRLSDVLKKKDLTGKKGLERSIQSHKRQGPQDYSIQRNYRLEWKCR